MKVKAISVLVIIFIIIISSTVSFGLDTSDYEPHIGTAYSETLEIGGNFISILQYVGIIGGVLALTIMGVKYMLGSVEEKAEYKKHMMPYLVGCIMVICTPTIVKLIEATMNSDYYGKIEESQKQEKEEQEKEVNEAILAAQKIVKEKSFDEIKKELERATEQSSWNKYDSAYITYLTGYCEAYADSQQFDEYNKIDILGEKCVELRTNEYANNKGAYYNAGYLIAMEEILADSILSGINSDGYTAWGYYHESKYYLEDSYTNECISSYIEGEKAVQNGIKPEYIYNGLYNFEERIEPLEEKNELSFFEKGKLSEYKTLEKEYQLGLKIGQSVIDQGKEAVSQEIEKLKNEDISNSFYQQTKLFYLEHALENPSNYFPE